MNILRDISVIWTSIHALIIFMLLFESRYPKKKTVILTLSTMVPLIALNIIMFFICGAEKSSTLMIFTLSLPSFIFFLIMAKHRDGRYIFTFCMVDTIVLEILYITNIIDNYLPGYWFMFITRLLVYPLIEWFVYKKIRPLYQEIQNQIKKGWLLFAFIGILFYFAIVLSMSIPTIITDRPEQMPSFIILLILMPISYLNIFNTLRHQQNFFRGLEQENILKIQVADIKNRIEEVSDANEKFRHERHNMRHKLSTIARMLENEEYGELRTIVAKYGEAMGETSVKRYCENAVLDAVFSAYIRRAESKGISVTANIRIPDSLPAEDVELATVFANSLENAINACEKLEPGQGHIDIKVIFMPQFMFRIENTFDGNVQFNSNGIPVTNEEGHGFGTLSIIAFCEKNKAFYKFKTKENKFIMQIIF